MRCSRAILALLSTALVASTALADEPDARRASARELANKGDAFFAKGRCDKGISLWAEANEHCHAPPLLLRIARCQALLGKVVLATETLQSIVSEPVDPSASQA